MRKEGQDALEMDVYFLNTWPHFTFSCLPHKIQKVTYMKNRAFYVAMLTLQ